MAWEVFISHRGPDTKGNVVELIRDRLRGRQVFVDKSSLQPGQSNWETILAALREARLVLIVLSPRYQQSPWCLEELRIAVEERWGDLRVICYGAGTSHVNDDTLKKTLEEFATSSTSNLLGRWQAALQKVSTVTGWWHDTATGSLPDLVDRVVKNLEGSLEAKPRQYGTYVGVQERVDELLERQEMQMTGGVRLLGLTGMGGIGKTTLATALYDRLKGEFVSAVCFVADVRARTSQPKGILEIQQQILQKLVVATAPLPSDKVEGKNELRDKLQGKRVLLILDDVGEKDWSLLPPRDDDERNFLSLSALGAGSLVIITSRVGAVLKTAGCTLHEVGLLTPQHSLHLFKMFVGVLEVSAETVESVVTKCGGLPLTLKVMAGHLKTKKKSVWDKAVGDLAKAEDNRFYNQPRLFERLRISYDGLNTEDQVLFVDVACFLEAHCLETLYGRRIEEATEALRDRYLLYQDGYGFIRMHDQLKDLGVSIEETENREQRIRVWGKLAERLIQELTERDTHMESCPTKRACLTNKWHKVRQLLRPECVKLPASISQLTSLERLRCRSALEKLPKSLGKLISLQSLDLSGCDVLKALPKSLGRLICLQTLDLSHCSALEELPSSLGKLTSLRRLSLLECIALESLPDSLGQLVSLRTLNLIDCSGLQTLPNSFTKLASLHTLCLGGHFALNTLPDFWGGLTSLQTLDLSCCSALQVLPASPGGTEAWHTPDLSYCYAYKELPESLSQLTNLRELCLGDRIALEKLPESLGQLTRLQTLDISGCSALEKLPESLDQLTNLQTLNLSCCQALEKLPESLGQLTSLQTLDLYGCEALKDLPESLGQLTSLQTLDLSRCSALEKLPESLGQLTNLQTLDLSCCQALEKLPKSLGQLTSLQTLDISGCSALESEKETESETESEIESDSTLGCVRSVYKSWCDL